MLASSSDEAATVTTSLSSFHAVTLRHNLHMITQRYYVACHCLDPVSCNMNFEQLYVVNSDEDKCKPVLHLNYDSHGD